MARWINRLVGAAVCLIAMLAAGSLFGNGPPVSLTLIDGRSIRCELQSIAADGTVHGQPLETALTIDSVGAIALDGRAIGSPYGPIRVVLANGGSLATQSVNWLGESVELDTIAGAWTVPTAAVRAIVFRSDTPHQLVAQYLAQPSQQQDMVIVETTNGQTAVAGLIEQIDSQRLVLQYEGASRSIAIDKVIAIVAADLGLSQPPVLRATLTMTDGSTVTGHLAQATDTHLQIELGETPIEVSWSSLVRVDVHSPRLMYLSDVEPIAVDEQAVVAAHYPWRRDLSAAGTALAVASPAGDRTQFQKGLGTHADCRLVFANERPFDRLMAIVGLNADYGGQGMCQATVMGDGVVLWTSQLSGRGEPVPIDVDIRGVERLELVVESGPQLDMADHVDWCDARLVDLPD